MVIYAAPSLSRLLPSVAHLGTDLPNGKALKRWVLAALSQAFLGPLISCGSETALHLDGKLEPRGPIRKQEKAGWAGHGGLILDSDFLMAVADSRGNHVCWGGGWGGILPEMGTRTEV